MKIQCACGAKYSFDATPEMLQSPVRFVCPNCGLDSSDYVNEMIRQELGAPAPAPVSAPPPEPPRLKISHAAPPPATPAPEEVAPPAAEPCAKHPREKAVHHCVVCGKPMCKQCMRLFGYVCSPLCRAKADAQNIDVPVYAGQATVAGARRWRVTGIIGGVIGALVVAGLGFWIWYAWIGSWPHVTFSVKFNDRAYAGGSRLCGTNQIIFLHGGTLARYDIKSGRKIWSDTLITKQQMGNAVAHENALDPTDRFGNRIPESRIEEAVGRSLEGMLHLHVSSQNIWVSTPEQLAHYDWNTGKVMQTIPLAGGTDFSVRNGEFLLVSRGPKGEALITHINPATGVSHVETVSQPGQTLVAAAAPGGNTGNPATGGLPLNPDTSSGGAMNAAKVAQQEQNLSMPARLALPAILANSEEEDQIAAALNNQNQTPSGAPAAKQLQPIQNPAGEFTLIPSPYGNVEFGVHLVRAHIVTQQAMEAPSQQSALNGNLTTSSEGSAINETLNNMQRQRGGGTVQVDKSLYQVSLRRPGSTGPADWTGQVTGPPALYPLKTVTVLAAGKTVIVFDKSNKKLWEAALTYNVASGGGANGEPSPFGAGPCVERGNTLYVIDQAVLTAFDTATGQARWRLPSVGIVGLFFDHKGMLYVNTTTANPENVKYSRQIDITQKIEAILLKIDPRTGRTLWTARPGGFISYLSGNYIYTVQSYNPGALAGTPMGILSPAYLKIRRINPASGRQIWDYEESRAPLAVQFKDNFIGLVFKKEVEVLKFYSF